MGKRIPKTEASASKFPRPFVSVNFAQTFDGKISTRNFTPSDFSSPRDKRRLLEIRASGDAVLVGKGTLEKENMSMGLPAADLRAARVRRKQTEWPLRVIVSNSGCIKTALKVFQHDVAPVLIYSTKRMPTRTRRALESSTILHLDDAQSVDLEAMLRDLRSVYKINRIVCEGGPMLLRSLLERDFVDEINLTICPRLFGGENAPTLTGIPHDFLPRTIACDLAEMKIEGDECFLRYRVRRAKNRV